MFLGLVFGGSFLGGHESHFFQTQCIEKYSLYFIFDGDRIEDLDTLMNDEELDLDDDFGIDVKEKIL